MDHSVQCMQFSFTNDILPSHLALSILLLNERKNHYFLYLVL